MNVLISVRKALSIFMVASITSGSMVPVILATPACAQPGSQSSASEQGQHKVTEETKKEAAEDSKRDQKSSEKRAENSNEEQSSADSGSKVTPLGTASGANDEYEQYMKQNKEHLKLLQQHEAVQHFNAAKHYMSVWDTELAELELRAAIMYMPDLKIAHRDYCLVAMLKGKPLRSLAEFCMVVGLGDAIPLNEKQQKDLREEASRAHYKRGLESARDGKWDDAISELYWSKTYLPNDPAIARSLAFAFANKGDFKKAQEFYQTALELDPGDPYAHADFAFLLSEKGNAEQAVTQMTQAVKLNPNATALHVDLGYLAEAKGDLETARKEFERSAELSPKQASLWYHLGEVQQKLNHKDAARVAYDKALALDPADPEIKEALRKLGSLPTGGSGPVAGKAPTSAKQPETVKPGESKVAGIDKNPTDSGKTTKLK